MHSDSSWATFLRAQPVFEHRHRIAACNSRSVNDITSSMLMVKLITQAAAVKQSTINSHTHIQAYAYRCISDQGNRHTWYITGPDPAQAIQHAKLCCSDSSEGFPYNGASGAQHRLAISQSRNRSNHTFIPLSVQPFTEVSVIWAKKLSKQQSCGACSLPFDQPANRQSILASEHLAQLVYYYKKYIYGHY